MTIRVDQSKNAASAANVSLPSRSHRVFARRKIHSAPATQVQPPAVVNGSEGLSRRWASALVGFGMVVSLVWIAVLVWLSVVLVRQFT